MDILTEAKPPVQTEYSPLSVWTYEDLWHKTGLKTQTHLCLKIQKISCLRWAASPASSHSTVTADCFSIQPFCLEAELPDMAPRHLVTAVTTWSNDYMFALPSWCVMNVGGQQQSRVGSRYIFKHKETCSRLFFLVQSRHTCNWTDHLSLNESWIHPLRSNKLL